MADLSKTDDEDTQQDGSDMPPSSPTPTPTPRRGPGHRAADARDTAAEMAQRAHDISLEAGSRMAGAMRDVITAASGLNDLNIHSARELVNYMVRRGQMNSTEGDQLMAQAEAAYIARHGSLPEPEPKAAPPKPIPLGQLPKAVTAPAAAAEAALEARAAMRIEPQKPSDRVHFAPLPPKPAPRRIGQPAAAPAQAAAMAADAALAKKSAARDRSAATAAAKGTAKNAAAASDKSAGKPADKSAAKPAARTAAKTASKTAALKSSAKTASKTAAKPATKTKAAPATGKTVTGKAAVVKTTTGKTATAKAPAKKAAPAKAPAKSASKPAAKKTAARKK